MAERAEDAEYATARSAASVKGEGVASLAVRCLRCAGPPLQVIRDPTAVVPVAQASGSDGAWSSPRRPASKDRTTASMRVTEAGRSLAGQAARVRSFVSMATARERAGGPRAVDRGASGKRAELLLLAPDAAPRVGTFALAESCVLTGSAPDGSQAGELRRRSLARSVPADSTPHASPKSLVENAAHGDLSGAISARRDVSPWVHDRGRSRAAQGAPPTGAVPLLWCGDPGLRTGRDPLPRRRTRTLAAARSDGLAGPPVWASRLGRAGACGVELSLSLRRRGSHRRTPSCGWHSRGGATSADDPCRPRLQVESGVPHHHRPRLTGFPGGRP